MKALLWVPLAIAALGTRAADELRFEVESGTTITKSYRETTDWTLDLIDITMGDQPVPMDLPDCTGTTKRWLDITDEYVETKDGHIVALRRTFDSIGTDSRFQVEEMGSKHCACASELAEATVVFRWNGDEYECSFDGPGVDDDLLEGLDLDVDLLGILPDDEVEAGDTWEIEIEDLVRLFDPAGNLELLPHDSDTGTMEGIPTPYILGNALFNLGEVASELEGDGTATYTGRDEDGLARIEIDLELEADVDRTERFETFLVLVMDDPVTDDLELAVELDLTGTAVVLWNVDAGRFESVELDADFTMATRIAWREPSIRTNGEAVLFAADIELGGTSVITLGVEE